MSNRAKKLLEAALALPRDELAGFVDELCSAVSEAPDLALDAGWATEIERRIEEIDSGKVEMIPWEQVHNELRGIVRKSAARKSPSRRKSRSR